MGEGSVPGNLLDVYIELVEMVNKGHCGGESLRSLSQCSSTRSLTMYLGSTWSITASVANDDHRYHWMDLDVDQRMFSIGIILGYQER